MVNQKRLNKQDQHLNIHYLQENTKIKTTDDTCLYYNSRKYFYNVQILRRLN